MLIVVAALDTVDEVIIVVVTRWLAPFSLFLSYIIPSFVAYIAVTTTTIIVILIEAFIAILEIKLFVLIEFLIVARKDLLFRIRNQNPCLKVISMTNFAGVV